MVDEQQTKKEMAIERCLYICETLFKQAKSDRLEVHLSLMHWWDVEEEFQPLEMKFVVGVFF